MTIKQIQLLLEYLSIQEENDPGLSPGPIDGIQGRQTNAALRRVQCIWGVGPEGLIGILAGTVAKLDKILPIPPSSGSWWDTIRYFARSEFRCHGDDCDGFPAEPAEKLVRMLDDVREHFGAPGIISSGARCGQHNAEVGGVYNSRHLLGWAADVCFEGIPPAQVLAYVQQHPSCAYAYSIKAGGKETGYVHMDVVV